MSYLVNRDSNLTEGLTVFEFLTSDLDEAEFWNWVEGSKHEQIRARLERLQQDHELAVAAKAQFLTSLPASKDLSVVDMTPAGRQRTATTMALLKMDLPYFDKASFASIAKARSEAQPKGLLQN